MGALIDIPSGLIQKAGIKSEKDAKLIVYGVYVIMAGVAVALVIHQVKKFFGKTTEKVDSHTVSGSRTITNDDAKSIAERLWGNINGNLIVTFDSLMTDIPDSARGTMTPADKAMVYNYFGIRSNGFPFYTKGDLYFWLDRKLKFGINSAKQYWGF